MRKIFFAVGLLISLTLQAIAQPKDVEGWNKAKWGMTEDEILKAFEGQIEKLPQPKVEPSNYSNLVLRGVEIGGNKFFAQFWFGKSSNQLEGIELVPEDKSKNSSYLYSSLERMLIQKYGQPSFVDNQKQSGIITKSRIWNFPTSTIDLAYDEVPILGDPPSIEIVYRPNKKEENL